MVAYATRFRALSGLERRHYMFIRRSEGRRRFSILTNSETISSSVVLAGIASAFESRRFVIYGDDYRLIVP